MKMFWLGDAGMLFVWPETEESGEGIGPAAIAKRAAYVRELRLVGVRECVPAYRSMAVHLDLTELLDGGRSLAALREAVLGLAERLRKELDGGVPTALRADCSANPVPSEYEVGISAAARLIRLPVIYGGEDGPDLEACAQRSGMSPEAFVQAHASGGYEVAMIGFAPGFPYLEGLPESLVQPRRESPRLQVPAGAVGIAGLQTGVYPVRSPGGWQWIGRTPVRLFRPESDDPFLLKPGDRVKFVPTLTDSEITDFEIQLSGKVHPVLQGVDASGTKGLGSESAMGLDAIQLGNVSFSDTLEVLKPGMMTTVQDRGRHGWQSFGVSVGGAMDQASLRLANALVGNPADAAVLEMTLIGAEFRVMRDLLLSVCGGDLEAHADGEALPMHCPVWLRTGSTLVFGNAKRGCRAYLALAGGVATPAVLGSRSTDTRFGLEGPGGRALVAGDKLPVGEPSLLGRRIATGLHAEADRSGRAWAATVWQAEVGRSRRTWAVMERQEEVSWSSSSWAAAARQVEVEQRDQLWGMKRDRVEEAGNLARQQAGTTHLPVEIRVVPGAQWEEFTAEGHRRLLKERYRVTADSDRMGIRLSGPHLPRESDRELASHGVVPGTIQVPAGGLPIILTAGCQPTGGYPVLAHVIGADLPMLAQCKPGCELTFRRVDLNEAWLAWQLEEHDYRLLQAGISLAGGKRS